MNCIQILLPALVATPEQARMTEDCKKSIVSLEHCVKVKLDTKKYEAKVAGVWNAFLDEWRDKDYDYLVILANDTLLDPCMIDYGVRTLEQNPDAGVCTFHVTRDLEEFKKGFGQQLLSGELTQRYSDMDPANFMIRRGVIEKVGRIDETFPAEFVERDYWHRCNKLGFRWIEPKEILNYHPPYAGTIGNDTERLMAALKKYMRKMGGDAGAEKYQWPYNDMNLDWTFSEKYNG